MDHIPYPPNAIVPPVKVPFLAPFEYDRQGYAEFPQRKGFIVEGTLDLDLDRPSEVVVGFAQAWLFFGLLSELLGSVYNTNLFVRQETDSDTSHCTVDTSSLSSLLLSGHKLMYANLGREKQLPEIRRTILCALNAGDQLDGLESTNMHVAAVVLSIKALHIYVKYHFNNILSPMGNPRSVFKFPESLQSSLIFIHETTWKPKPVLEQRRAFHQTPVAKLLISRLLSSGWCKQQVQRWCRKLDHFMVYYLSAIPRGASSANSHQDCSENQCIANNTSPSEYIIKHVSEECTCDLIEVPYERVTDIVAKGGVPLIDIRENDHSHIRLEVVEHEYKKEYTALSHIWIDGLGNPTSNALPECQLRKLAKDLQNIEARRLRESILTRMKNSIVQRSTRNNLLWMDTLCIPVRNDALRWRAINRMSFIYAAARQVLVVDNELDHLQSSEVPNELCHAMKLCSKWNSRAWTLQEGMLATQRVFRFQLCRSLNNTIDDDIGKQCLKDFFYKASQSYPLFRQTPERLQLFWTKTAYEHFQVI